MILLTFGSFLFNIHLEFPVPTHLQFLSKLYSEQIIFSGIKTIFMVYAISIIYSFALYIYFNRNPIRKGISIILYAGLLYSYVDFVNGPMSGIKQYLVSRQAIENIKPDETERAILKLKDITTHQRGVISGYKFSKKRLNEDDQKILKQDYLEMIKKIDVELGKIKVSKN